MSLPSSLPYTFAMSEPTEAARKLFPNLRNSSGLKTVNVTPGNCVVTEKFKRMAESIYNFELRSDDIWIVTFPKSGTTWVQETVWQLLQNVNPEASRDGKHLYTRSPFLEMSSVIPDDTDVTPRPPSAVVNPFTDSVGYTKNLESPRVIKTHLPFSMLPPKLLDTCKVICVSRNPRDVCVSYYHHHVNFKHIFGFEGQFKQFATHFQMGKCLYGDYWTHLENCLAHKSNPNMLHIWYEEFTSDTAVTLKKINKHLGLEDLSADKLKLLGEHVSLDSMRRLAVANAEDDSKKKLAELFYRNGKVGDWMTYFAGPEIQVENQIWDKWVDDNTSRLNIDISYM